MQNVVKANKHRIKKVTNKKHVSIIKKQIGTVAQWDYKKKVTSPKRTLDKKRTKTIFHIISNI